MYLRESGGKAVDVHRETAMSEVRAILDIVLSELTEKGDYTKFDDSTIDDIPMTQLQNFESSTPILHSNLSSPSEIIHIPRKLRRSCLCDSKVPGLMHSNYDEAPSVPITPSSSMDIISNSTPILTGTETLIVKQLEGAERPMFHLSCTPRLESPVTVQYTQT